MKHEGWAGLADPVQMTRLARYEELLRSIAVPRGMIAASDAGHLRDRHVLDSLRGAPHIGAEVRRACDIGSGAGLPGVPLAIVLPRIQFVLTESRRARAAFLELVVDELDLANTAVFPGRAGDLAERFEAALARGFGAPAASWAAAERLLGPGGVLLYWAGAAFSPDQVPSGVLARVSDDIPLESGGPIVIMARQ